METSVKVAVLFHQEGEGLKDKENWKGSLHNKDRFNFIITFQIKIFPYLKKNN